MSPPVGAAPAPALRDESRHMRLLRGGDPHAVDELYRDYQPRLLAFCRQLLGSQEEAEDAVQLTFLAAHVQLPHEPLDTNVGAWLFTVARRKSIDIIRRRRPTEPLDGHEAVAALGLSAEVEQREDLRNLVADVQRLDEPHRAALILTQLEALPQAEVATVLGTHEARVRRLVFEARQSLLDRRESRNLECRAVQEELANARGSQFRRRHLVNHCEQCEECDRYRSALLAQRTALRAIMPALPLMFSAKKAWGASSVPHAAPRFGRRVANGVSHASAHTMAVVATVVTIGAVAAMPQGKNLPFDDGVPAAGVAPAAQQHSAASSNAPAAKPARPAERRRAAKRRKAKAKATAARARARARAAAAPAAGAAPLAAPVLAAAAPAAPVLASPN
ncbi:MAG TPA: RNA polymerase sigma factor, partial [Casimicrobiaceae bacterium]